VIKLYLLSKQPMCPLVMIPVMPMIRSSLARTGLATKGKKRVRKSTLVVLESMTIGALIPCPDAAGPVSLLIKTVIQTSLVKHLEEETVPAVDEGPMMEDLAPR
jgi:hypothetical protein